MKRVLLSYIFVICCTAATFAQDATATIQNADSIQPADTVLVAEPATTSEEIAQQKEKTKKVKKTKAEKILRTIPEMYVYAVGMSAADSVVYMTDIQILQNAKINQTNGFLMGRNHFSAQFASHLAEIDQPNRMCAVMFDEKGAKLAAEYEKLKKKYQKKGFLVKVIDISEFKFIVTE